MLCLRQGVARDGLAQAESSQKENPFTHTISPVNTMT